MSWRAGLALTIAVCMAGATTAHAGVVIHSSTKDLKSGREAGLRHAHDLLGNPVGLLFVDISGPVDNQLRLYRS